MSGAASALGKAPGDPVGDPNRGILASFGQWGCTRYGSTRWQILEKIKLPLTRPLIMSGIRSMATMTFVFAGIASLSGAAAAPAQGAGDAQYC